MKVYVSHSRNFDFKNELYLPLQGLGGKAEFIFPHQDSADGVDSKDIFKNHGCDLVLSEVSFPSTGQGIEMGWADVYNIPIICIYKSGSKTSSSLKKISKTFIEYSNTDDLVNKLKPILNEQTHN